MRIELNIEALLKERGLTSADVHRMTGRRYNTIRDAVVNKYRRVDLEVLEDIAEVVGFENVSRFLRVVPDKEEAENRHRRAYHKNEYFVKPQKQR